jgi:acyl carrier protein
MATHDNISENVKAIIINSVGGDLENDDLTMQFQLVGNLLDSMSITNLIIGLEEHFGIIFDEDELSEESFRSVGSLIGFMKKKIG